MKEYIEREVVLNAIVTDGYEHFSGCLSSSEVRLIEAMKETVQEVPAADVVEVVRCKDCKHFISAQGVTVCDYFYGLGFPRPNGDDFCSQGERRDDQAVDFCPNCGANMKEDDK